MMVFTTLFAACLVLAALSLVALRKWCPAWAGYLLVIAAGVACLALGSVHFVYIGIEVIALGVLLIWVRHRFWPVGRSRKQFVSPRP